MSMYVYVCLLMAVLTYFKRADLQAFALAFILGIALRQVR